MLYVLTDEYREKMEELEAIEEARQEGIEKGIQKGIEKGKLDLIKEFMQNPKLLVEYGIISADKI